MKCDEVKKIENEKKQEEKFEEKADTKSDDNNQLVTIFEKGDNNNKVEKPIDINPHETVELKIIELPDARDASQNDKQISDIDDTLAIATSNSTTSPNLFEKSNEHVTKSILDNNNSTLTKLDEPVVINVPLQDDQASKSIVNEKDDCVDKAEEIKEDETTNVGSQLDINENKPDIKLNYAEVVKFEHSLDSHLCENTNYDKDFESGAERKNDNKNTKSTRKSQDDLDDKVQISNSVPVSGQDNDGECKKRMMEASSPKPIQNPNSSQIDENDEEMSPICKIRLPLNSPRLVKSKDIMSELPLTPDSSHSLDSSCEYSTSFEMKPYSTPIIPERSFSSESLNSETSMESNDSKSSIKLTEAKFSKNGTLERQNGSATAQPPPPTITSNGLQVLMLWNNNISRNAAQSLSDLLASTSTLEILNVGKNMLSNDFVTNIKSSLKSNTSLTSLGLQSAHLSSDGVKTLSEILDFGGNVTLQRVDLRDNNLQVSGLTALNEVLKSNKSITRIDLDDVPRRAHVSLSLLLFLIMCNEF